MLNNLHVKNLALIDEIEVDFGKGLNILTGETGAGKSIIIGSLGLALGDRAESDIIRQGAEYALVELSLSTENEVVWKALEGLGIPRESDEILIQRKIYQGRSVCRVNGETLTLRELAAVSGLMIDICGQRESLKLLKNTALRNMLDAGGGDSLKVTLEKIGEVYAEYRSISEKLSETDEDESLRKRKADLAAYELQEIDEASLKTGEDEILENEYRRMQHAARINEALGTVSQLMGFDNGGAAGAVSRAIREIRSISEYDESIRGMEDMLINIEALTADLGRDISRFNDSNEFDEKSMSEVQSRLDLINRLKDKYGNTIEQILEYRDARQEELERLSDHDAYVAGLIERQKKAVESLDKLCGEAHKLRCRAAEEMSRTLTDALQDMNFLSCSLNVEVEAEPGEYTAAGYDSIDFMISLNPGEPLKPLSSVASGGELSRIMLALKCVVADRDDMDTMVFDEIDTGISGVTAWKVASRMARLGLDHQVICITHQAQIAAFADHHYLIEKQVTGDRTCTFIAKLDDEGMQGELARMMGSDKPGEAALEAARDLKARAACDKLTH